jgi:pimeloyl-ACP methyl ester carboxylesterase
MRRAFSALIGWCALLAPGLAAGPARLVTGELAGAKYTVAEPASWNHRVLILAHGLRPADRPLLADLFPEHLAYRSLLDEGWLIAKTSYRRNGLIVADAMADIDTLRGHLTATYGVPERVLLEGDSMGGLVVTLLAERVGEQPPLYAGAVAVGAALQVRDPAAPELAPNHRPQVPLLFLTNRSELDGPLAYVSAPVVDPATPRPVLWRIGRDGHVNVNQRERLAALRALNAWIDGGAATLPQPGADAAHFDATVPPASVPSQVVRHQDQRGFDARAVEVSAVYGNVFLNAQPADFEAAGISRMTRFLLTAGDQTFRVMYGRDFNSVKRGEWVAFANADGFTWLARNFADAAAVAKLAVGDTVGIRRIDAEAPQATPPPRALRKVNP